MGVQMCCLAPLIAVEVQLQRGNVNRFKGGKAQAVLAGQSAARCFGETQF